MSDDPFPSFNALPLSMKLQLEEVCERFEQAWQTGQRPRIEDYLADTPEPGRSALLRELLALEFAYRRRYGDSLTPDEYHPRFPQHLELIQEVFFKVDHADPQSGEILVIH